MKVYAHEDQGALVVDVKEEYGYQRRFLLVCLLKSDGASLYAYYRPGYDCRTYEAVSTRMRFCM